VRSLLSRHGFPLAVGAVAALFLGLFFVFPLIKVFGASVLDATGTSFTLANYTSVLSNPFFLNGLANSLTIAATSAVFAVLAAVPFAFCLARLPIGGKAVLLALAALPLVLPSFVSAYALVLLFGRSGIVTGMLRSLGIPFESLYGAKGIITVYTLTLYPYVALPVIAAFKSVDVSVEEAAQNLGATRARVLRTVTLPLVLPSILAGGLLVFIEALENRELLSAGPIHAKSPPEVLAADRLDIATARAAIPADKALYNAHLKIDRAAVPLARKSALALIKGAKQAIKDARGNASEVAKAQGELLIAKGRLKSDVADAVAQIKTTQGAAKIALANDKAALNDAIRKLRIDRVNR